MIGENPQGAPNNLIPLVAQVAAGQRDRINVFGDDYPTPDGTAMRDYIHVMDLAEGHLAALQFLNAHAGWHSFNLGTGEASSVLQMIRTFENASDKKIPFIKVGRRVGDVAVTYANAGKAKEQLGWQTKRGMDQMCASAWKFQVNCRIHNPQ